MIQAWEYVAQSVEAFPWDTTYMIGPMGLDRHHDGSHGWEPASDSQRDMGHADLEGQPAGELHAHGAEQGTPVAI